MPHTFETCAKDTRPYVDAQAATWAVAARDHAYYILAYCDVVCTA